MDTNKDLKYRLYLHKEHGFTRTPFRSEFERYKDIQNGDIKKVKENLKVIMKNYNDGKGVLSDNPLTNIKYHVIISTAITARICVEGGLNHDEAYTLSDIYIQKVDKASDEKTILKILEEMQLDFATKMKLNKKETAISIHIRKCIDYIYDHLNEKITISTLANYVGRNSTYLSKLFADEVGTPIHEFIINTRIETAKNMLQHSDISYIEIATSLGFSSQSSFTYIFRTKTGMTPKEYRTFNYGRELITYNQ